MYFKDFAEIQILQGDLGIWRRFEHCKELWGFCRDSKIARFFLGFHRDSKIARSFGDFAGIRTWLGVLRILQRFEHCIVFWGFCRDSNIAKFFGDFAEFRLTCFLGILQTFEDYKEL